MELVLRYIGMFHHHHKYYLFLFSCSFHDYTHHVVFIAYFFEQMKKTQDQLPLVSMVAPTRFYRIRVAFIPIQPANTAPTMPCWWSGTAKRRIVARVM
jgi:hypothetical protein